MTFGRKFNFVITDLGKEVAFGKFQVPVIDLEGQQELSVLVSTDIYRQIIAAMVAKYQDPQGNTFDAYEAGIEFNLFKGSETLGLPLENVLEVVVDEGLFRVWESPS
jgi:hypothetical protein